MRARRVTFQVKHSTRPPYQSYQVSEEFDCAGLTAFGGANLLVDFMRNDLALLPKLAEIPVRKAPWATYTVAQDMECLLTGYMLGAERISHMDDLEYDPLLQLKLGLDKLPQHCTFYRTLERFNTKERVAGLQPVNRHVLARIIPENSSVTLDIDTTVETTHGRQEGTAIGYNPRYHGRPSYQPFVAFDGNSKAAVHAELRSGKAPDADEKVTFYNQARAQLPGHCKVEYCRADRAFASEKFCAALEKDAVNYAIKVRLTTGLWSHMCSYARWRLAWADSVTRIETASLNYKAQGWDRQRRIVVIRTLRPVEDQSALFPEYRWDYEAMVTNLTWDGADVGEFYNQRCTCENYIKELKYGLRIDAIAKAGFWPNAADLMIKVMAYNVLLALRSLADKVYQCFSIERFRRALLRVPAILVKHARRWRLRLPSYWRHQEAWFQIRAAITTA